MRDIRYSKGVRVLADDSVMGVGVQVVGCEEAVCADAYICVNTQIYDMEKIVSILATKLVDAYYFMIPMNADTIVGRPAYLQMLDMNVVDDG